jgi:hypothetical protein
MQDEQIVLEVLQVWQLLGQETQKSEFVALK